MKKLRSKLIKETMDYFNHESNEPSPTFNMDLIKGKVQDSMVGVENESDVYDYLQDFKKNVVNMKPKFRKYLTKVVIASLITVTSLNTVVSVIGEPEEIKKSLTIKKNDMFKTQKETPKTYQKKFIVPNTLGIEFTENLKKEEGSAREKGKPILSPYKLKDGKITIGWGHAEPLNNSKYKMGDKITVGEAEELLKKDIDYAKRAVDDIFKDWKEEGIEYNISQNMYDAMVSMAFNMGRSGFRKTKFIQLVKKGMYEEARDIIPKTNVTFKGHVNRRENEKKLFGKNMTKLRDTMKMSEQKSNYIKDKIRETNFKYEINKVGVIKIKHRLDESFSFEFKQKEPTNKIIEKLNDRVYLTERYYDFYKPNLERKLSYLLKGNKS